MIPRDIFKPGLKGRVAVAHQIRSQGGLVGAFGESQFETVHVDLSPGDRVLFHTDGLDALLLDRRCPQTAPDLTRCPWFTEQAQRPIEELFASIHELLNETPPSAWHADDVTLLALEVHNGQANVTSAGS